MSIIPIYNLGDLVLIRYAMFSFIDVRHPRRCGNDDFGGSRFSVVGVLEEFTVDRPGRGIASQDLIRRGKKMITDEHGKYV